MRGYSNQIYNIAANCVDILTTILMSQHNV